MRKKDRKISNLIINQLEYYTGVDLMENPKRRSIRDVELRSIYYRLMRDSTTCSLQQIADKFKKNHASVIHSLRHSFDSTMFYNEDLKNIYEKIQEEIQKITEKKEGIYHNQSNKIIKTILKELNA